MTNVRLCVTLTCACDTRRMADLLALEYGLSEQIDYIGFQNFHKGQLKQVWMLLAGNLVRKAKKLSALVCSSVTPKNYFFRSILSNARSHQLQRLSLVRYSQHYSWTAADSEFFNEIGKMVSKSSHIRLD